MKIYKTQTISQNICFHAGKVHVFSDFDRTFLPSSHKNFVRNHDERFVNAIRENFKSFKEFLEKTREGLKFTITTGRTFGEFLTMAETARERKFGMPLPDTLIVKNGSDEHIRVGTDEAFYNGGEFPFKYEVTNKEKEEKIKKISGWDGAKVKQILKDVFNSYNLRIAEADSEHGIDDYGSRSIFAKLSNHSPNDWSAGLRRDGKLKVFSLYPAEESKKQQIAEIQKKIEDALDKLGIKWSRESSYIHGGYIGVTLEPQISPNQKLTKQYDTIEAVKDAVKNNDLVITAGDSSNDAEMLNPGLYLEHFLNENEKTKFGSAFRNPQSLISELDKNPELAKKFLKLPFAGIIVKQQDGSNKLSYLDAFTKGKYQKLIVVEQGGLEQGIKDVINLYAEQNSEYAEKISPDIKKQINPPASGGDDSRPPKNSLWKYFLTLLGVTAGGYGIYIWDKKRKNTHI